MVRFSVDRLASSPPDTDLSVFPIVPPAEPACPKASEPHARDIRMARRGLAAAPIIRVPYFNRGNMILDGSISS